MILFSRYRINAVFPLFVLLLLGALPSLAVPAPTAPYTWTPDHIQVGVRWQPYGRPANDAYDAKRPVISQNSSYVQFWLSWAAAEPKEINTSYTDHQSDYLRTIDDAVNKCVALGLKTEIVFMMCPSWASESGKSGAWKPKPGYYAQFARRIATHFKGRVDAYQLYHESNIINMTQDGDVDTLIQETFVNGTKAIRSVYDAEPKRPVIITPTGMSPCEGCGVIDGLKGKGAVAIDDFYAKMIANKELMGLVDGLNINVADHYNGYGMVDGLLISSVWGQYDLVRERLDKANYPNKKIFASESWVTWDDTHFTQDVNGDGIKNEQDAFDQTITIFGRLLERGLNTINLPWSDNSSAWSMGLTKRRDYNGRVKSQRPDIVIPASDGGADIVTRKVALHGGDNSFKVVEKTENPFTIDHYINPPDPNHLHYYVWKWYAQLAAGSDETIRHAIAGERGNDIQAFGPAMTGPEQYRLSSYNRSNESFVVLIYAGGASGKTQAKIGIPATIQKGYRYNNESSSTSFVAEGFKDGEAYIAEVVSKNLSRTTGEDVDLFNFTAPPKTVKDNRLTVDVPTLNKFTTVIFRKAVAKPTK